MATRLSGLARRIAAPKGLLPVKGGGGGPVALTRAPTQPLREEDELIWDDGTANPEYCLDRETLLTKWEGVGYLAAGLGVFGLIGLAAKINNKPVKQPYANKQFPYEEPFRQGA